MQWVLVTNMHMCILPRPSPSHFIFYNKKNLYYISISTSRVHMQMVASTLYAYLCRLISLGYASLRRLLQP